MALNLGLITEQDLKPTVTKPVVTTVYDTFDVTVTAYTLSEDETDSDPFTGAWNNKLTSNMKVVALSRDLEKYGLTNGSIVSVPGYGVATVKDRMNKRWKMKMDVLLPSKKKAFAWGRRQKTVTVIQY